MPQTLLYGDAPGGLNTDGAAGQQHWERTCAGRWDEALYPALSDLYRLLFAAQRGPFKGKAPDSWDIVRNPIYVPTAIETATIRKTNAEADAAYVTALVLTPEHVARSRFRETGYGDDILPVEELPEENPAAQAAAEEEVRAQVAASKPQANPTTATEAKTDDDEDFRRRRFDVPDAKLKE
jgi:hypothetical protein